MKCVPSSSAIASSRCVVSTGLDPWCLCQIGQCRLAIGWTHRGPPFSHRTRRAARPQPHVGLPRGRRQGPVVLGFSYSVCRIEQRLCRTDARSRQLCAGQPRILGSTPPPPPPEAVAGHGKDRYTERRRSPVHAVPLSITRPHNRGIVAQRRSQRPACALPTGLDLPTAFPPRAIPMEMLTAPNTCLPTQPPVAGKGTAGASPCGAGCAPPRNPPGLTTRGDTRRQLRGCRGRGGGPLRARPPAGCHSPPRPPTAPPRPSVRHEASRPPRPTDPLHQRRPITPMSPRRRGLGGPRGVPSAAACPHVPPPPPAHPPRGAPPKTPPQTPHGPLPPPPSPAPRHPRRQTGAGHGGRPPPSWPPRPAIAPPPPPRPGGPHPRGRGRPHLAPAVVTNTAAPAGPDRVPCDGRSRRTGKPAVGEDGAGGQQKGLAPEPRAATA